MERFSLNGNTRSFAISFFILDSLWKIYTYYKRILRAL